MQRPPALTEFVIAPFHHRHTKTYSLLFEDAFARIFNLMFYIPTFQRPSASLFIGARAR